MGYQEAERVLNHSKASGTAKLMLMAIAMHDGIGGAWPSRARLAMYANVTERNVRVAIKSLEDAGELRVLTNQGGTDKRPAGHRPNLYQILVQCPPECDKTDAHRMPREVSITTPRGESETTPREGSPATPKPSSEPSLEPSVGDPQDHSGDSENHSGLHSSRLDDLRSPAKIPRPRRKAKTKRVLTPEQLGASWQNFLTMDLGELDTDRDTRGASFLELQLDHGAIEPDKWAQGMIDKGEWDGFCAGFGLGSNRQPVWPKTQSA